MPEANARWTRWLAVSAAVVVARPRDQGVGAGRLRARRSPRGDALLQPGPHAQHGRGVQLPRRRRRLAALVLHRRHDRRLAVIVYMLSASTAARAGRRSRSRSCWAGRSATSGTASRSATWWISCRCTPRDTIGPRSTSPTPPSRWVSRSSSGTACAEASGRGPHERKSRERIAFFRRRRRSPPRQAARLLRRASTAPSRSSSARSSCTARRSTCATRSCTTSSWSTTCARRARCSSRSWPKCPPAAR